MYILRELILPSESPRGPAPIAPEPPAQELGYLGYPLTEHRHGYIMDTAVTAATEPDAAIVISASCRGPLGASPGANQNVDTRDWVDAAHLAVWTASMAPSAFDGCATRHPGYEISQRRRKLVEQDTCSH